MTFLRPAARRVLPALSTRPPQGFRPPSLPGRALSFSPLRPERPRSLRPTRSPAWPAPASRPGRPVAGGNLPDGRSARPPFLPAPCGPPARPSDLKPALTAARGNPSSSGGPTAPSSTAATEAAKPTREQSAAARCWAVLWLIGLHLATTPRAAHPHRASSAVQHHRKLPPATHPLHPRCQQRKLILQPYLCIPRPFAII